MFGFFKKVSGEGYIYSKDRYRDSFIVVDNDYAHGQQDYKKVIYAFWTGDNELTENRKASIERIRENIGIDFVLVTKDNLDDYILPEYPLHPGFQYLSCVHKSDYLRCYFMHHFGGGYTDVKGHNQSWVNAFDLFANSDKYILGYKEIGAIDVAIVPGTIGKDLRKYWSNVIGNGAYICRPYSPFTTDWYVELHKRMDDYHDQLKACPGNVYGDNEGYPIPWTNILGDIFHPLCLKYHDKIMTCEDIKPDFKYYR